jgi:hypothetical protein
MAQLPFNLIALFAQIVLTKGSTNGDRKVPYVIHSNTISGAFRNKFRHRFHLHCVGQEDAGNMSIPQMQDFEHLRALPAWGWVVSSYYLIIF